MGQQQQASCRAARCAGGGDGCCILRYLGRLMMIPIFMMSFCCPLCTFISVACLFSSFCSGCGGCGYRRYRCSTWRGVSGSGNSPRFRCGTTGMATSTAATSTSETQQNQPETKHQSKVIPADTSASAALKTECSATLQPLLQEVVAKDEPDEEDIALQRALAESLLECNVDSSELGPQSEPEPQQDLQLTSEQEKVAQVAQSMDQIGEEEGSDVAAGFVEVMYDDDQ